MTASAVQRLVGVLQCGGGWAIRVCTRSCRTDGTDVVDIYCDQNVVGQEWYG